MTNFAPTIGIMPVFDDSIKKLTMPKGYAEAVEAAGGTPVILPLTQNLDTIERVYLLCDGFIFTGGHDIAPEMYGQERSTECGPVCEKRDDMESRLLKLAVSGDKPVLGICRGIQLINAALGGSLYQDLEKAGFSELCHTPKEDGEKPLHLVEISRDTPLYEIFSSREIWTNSYHHQAVHRLAPGLTEAAWSKDGIVEALYMPQNKFFISVQWHPELTYKYDGHSLGLFEALVKSCGENL